MLEVFRKTKREDIAKKQGFGFLFQSLNRFSRVVETLKKIDESPGIDQSFYGEKHISIITD